VSVKSSILLIADFSRRAGGMATAGAAGDGGTRCWSGSSFPAEVGDRGCSEEGRGKFRARIAALTSDRYS
jgi:hypothetical protein